MGGLTASEAREAADLAAAVHAAVEDEAAARRRAAESEAAARQARARALERIRLQREKEREATLLDAIENPTPRRKNQTDFIHDEIEARRALHAEEERRESEGERLAAMAEQMERAAERERIAIEEAERAEAQRQSDVARIIEEHWNNNRRRIAAAEDHRQRMLHGKKIEASRLQGRIESSQRATST